MTELSIQPMQVINIPAVVTVEKLAFGEHWLSRDYTHELEHNELAHYFVLYHEAQIIGVAGFWLMADQIHISTIAVAPHYQRRGLAAQLLRHLLAEGQRLGATEATLEVRVSNVAAIALYQQYGFDVVGRRKRYYRDNGEDALILTTPPFDTAGGSLNDQSI